MNIKFEILMYLVIFLIVFIITLIINMIKYKNNNLDKIIELNYLLSKFNLKVKDINIKNHLLIISLIDGIIISLVVNLISYLKFNYLVRLAIGFALLVILIYIIYEIYGKILKAKRKEKKR